jgi:geranylgeranylglycerol-phosphate geranylgeranyltransferase
LSAVVRLARVHNGLIAALGVIAGAWWAGGTVTARSTALAAASALFLAGFANAFNDWRDVDIDRIAHPERPLARAQLSRSAGLAIAVVCGALAIAVSAVAWPALAVTSALVVAAMALYSTHLKRDGVTGNALVALLASLPFLYGCWSAGNPRAAVPLLAIAIPWHFAREIAKDLDDVEGDRSNRRTLPLARGEAVARRTAIAALGVGALALLPLMLGHLRFALFAIPAVVLCLAAAGRLLRGRRGAALLLKSAMVCAMLSLIAARP